MSHRSPSGTGRICVIHYGVVTGDSSLQREVKALADEGFDVTVLCARRPGTPPVHTGTAGKICAVAPFHAADAAVSGSGTVGVGLWRALFAAKWFACVAGARLLIEHLRRRFDYVQVDNPPDFLILATLLLRLGGVHVVMRVSEPEPEYWLDRMPAWYQRPVITALRVVQRLGLHLAQHVVVNNRQMRVALAQRGADINRVSVVLDIEATAGGDEYGSTHEGGGRLRREERGRSAFRVVTRATSATDRGVVTIIDAIALLRDRLPGVECVVLTAVPLAELLERARRLGVADRVQCISSTEGDDALRRVWTADVGVVSRPWTPYTSLVLPTVLFDYVALGKPMIAARLEAIASYFPDDSLFYFRPGDAEDLANTIYTVFAHPEEVPVRVKNASEIGDAHRWERERKKYVGVFTRSD